MNYYHLNIEERTVISQLYVSGLSIREISRQIGRSPSTVSREIRRNSYKSGTQYTVSRYNPTVAQKKYVANKGKCGRKTISNSDTLTYIRSKIEDHWSPEQIANRLNPGFNLPSVTTIYRMIRQKRLGKIEMKDLRRKGHFRRPAEKRGKFNDGGRTIKKRDKSVYKRQQIGHWEADTVESGRNDHKRKSKYCFVTLAERKSRKYIAIKVPDRTAASVTPVIINALKDYPKELVKTITFDRGKEFCGYEEIEKSLGCKTYFCDPYCAWQKGTNENSNGLLREFYPKGMDLSEVDETKLKENLDLMNGRPRKCLGYQTPNEVFNSHICST